MARDGKWVFLLFIEGFWYLETTYLGVKAIENLLARRMNFDCVLLETTGLADPAPIASMFWLDSALESNVFLSVSSRFTSME